MSDKPIPLFLERRSYRQRRLMDAARLMPVLGGVLWGVPLLWPQGDKGAVETSTAILYLFGVWIVLAWLALLISRHLDDEDTDSDPGAEGRL